MAAFPSPMPPRYSACGEELAETDPAGAVIGDTEAGWLRSAWPRPPQRQRHRPYIVTKWQQLAPCIQNNATLKKGGLR